MSQYAPPQVLELFARTILQVRRTDTPTEAISLAWALRNRAERAHCKKHNGRGIAPELAEQVSKALQEDMQGVSSENGSRLNGATKPCGSGATEEAFNRVLACVSMVWEGVVPDPTRGATRVHPHDQQPDWARDYEATALIGALLFFRSGQADHKQHGSSESL